MMVHLFRKFLACVFALLLVAGGANAQSAANTLGQVPQGKLPEGVSPLSYHLSLRIVPSEENFSGTARIKISLEKATSQIWMHGLGLAVSEVHVELADGSQLGAKYNEVDKGGVVSIDIDGSIPAGEATLEITYTAKFGKSLRGLYSVESASEHYAYTQLQAVRARRVFPSFDEPRFKVPVTLELTIPDDNVAVSAMAIEKTEHIDGNMKRLRFYPTKPIPTYLLSIAVGRFDVVEAPAIPANEIRSRPVPFRGIAPKGRGGELAIALQSTSEILTLLEEYFGTPYPYEKLDLVAPAAFSAGGMENVGAIYYRSDRILFDGKPSVHQWRSFVNVHAHELAHSWFGNLVTPKWWDDIWLNESFATWMAGKIAHQWRPKEFNDRWIIRGGIGAKWSDRLVSARQIRQPVNNNGDIRNAFDSITYSKGGAVLSMIEKYMGAESFRDGIRLFMKRHRHGVASSEDFFAALSEVAGDDSILDAFQSFIAQPGTPNINFEWACGPGGGTRVKLEQSRSLPIGSKGKTDKKWSIPICLAYQQKDGRDEKCFMLKEVNAEIELPGSECRAWVLPNARGAAYVNFSSTSAGWEALIANWEQLEPGEKLSVVSSASAAFETGTLSPKTIVELARKAVLDDNWDIVRAPIQVLRNIKLNAVPRAKRAEMEKLLQKIYAPILPRFDLSAQGLAREVASSNLALQRSEVVWSMALDARSESLRKTLAQLGSDYVGFGSKSGLNKNAIHRDLVAVSMIVAAQEIGIPYLDHLTQILLKSEDQSLRDHIFRAMGFQTVGANRDWVIDFIMNPETRKRDGANALRRMARLVDNSEFLFEWITENYNQVLERIPKSHHPWMVWRTSNLCKRGDAARVRAFFADKVTEYRGAERSLENVIEAIDICSAISEKHRANAISMLEQQ